MEFWMTFHEKLGILQIPTVTHSIIFQRGRLKPPTSFGTTFTTRDALAQFLKTVSSPAIGRSYQLSYIHHLRSWDIGRIFILTVLGQTIFLNHPQSPKHRWYLSCLRGTVPWVPRNLMADHHFTSFSHNIFAIQSAILRGFPHLTNHTFLAGGFVCFVLNHQVWLVQPAQCAPNR